MSMSCVAGDIKL